MRSSVILGAAVLAAALPALPARAADAAAGRDLARTRCAVCHGLDGLAVNPMAPNLAGENAAYVVAQLKAFRDGRRRHEQMSIIASGLSDADIANVAAWYSRIIVRVELPDLD
ncbi:MAG: cytochrome c [Alphaproteobacteria bacterium]|nr:MAG: cytochrome c [Alphaproteobacteria bacterium]